MKIAWATMNLNHNDFAQIRKFSMVVNKWPAVTQSQLLEKLQNHQFANILLFTFFNAVSKVFSFSKQMQFFLEDSQVIVLKPWDQSVLKYWQHCLYARDLWVKIDKQTIVWVGSSSTSPSPTGAHRNGISTWNISHAHSSQSLKVITMILLR